MQQTSTVWVDYAIIGIIVLSTLIGVVRGFLREVFSFVIWLAALFVAWTFHKELAGAFAHWITSAHLRLVAAFLILVLGVQILGAILGSLLSMLLKKKGLVIGNRILGGIFGATRGAAILVAMAVYLGLLTPWPEEDWWRQSFLIGHFEVLAEWILERIPAQVTDRMKEL